METKIVANSIFEAASQSKFSSKMELIEVVKMNDRHSSMALLRAKAMAEYAFVAWSQPGAMGRRRITIRLAEKTESQQFGIVCGCCIRWIPGCPHNEVSDREDWMKEAAKMWYPQFVDVCKALGISTIFVRKNRAWEESYGKVDDLRVIGAGDHFDAYLDLYGRKTVRSELAFIGDGSEGLRPDWRLY